MRRLGIALGVLLVCLLAGASIAAGIAECQPSLQSGDDGNCIDCHTDAATLQELAVEPEEEELSEGEG